MKAFGSNDTVSAIAASPHHALEGGFDPLTLLSQEEIASMLNSAVSGQLPADFEQKLQKLKNGDLQQSMIEQNCRIFFALLEAALRGEFTDVTRQEVEQLARVLAYVRKEDDLIPDYRCLGFSDDFHEVRLAAANGTKLLHSFKHWRLRHQVPGFWLSKVRQPPITCN